MKKVCCNCKHCIREDYKGVVVCVCELDGTYLHYQTVMCGKCMQWKGEEDDEQGSGDMVKRTY